MCRTTSLKQGFLFDIVLLSLNAGNNMKTSIKTVLVAAVIASASVSLPASAGYTVFGYGSSSCETWTDDKANNSFARDQGITWVRGFVTAVGWSANREYETDSAEMIGWVDNHCQANPLEKIAETAEALIYELEK